MSALDSIEHQILSLTKTEAAKLQDWLSDYLEEKAELSDEFITSIEKGRAELAAGETRISRP